MKSGCCPSNRIQTCWHCKEYTCTLPTHFHTSSVNESPLMRLTSKDEADHRRWSESPPQTLDQIDDKRTILSILQQSELILIEILKYFSKKSTLVVTIYSLQVSRLKEIQQSRRLHLHKLFITPSFKHKQSQPANRLFFANSLIFPLLLCLSAPPK